MRSLTRRQMVIATGAGASAIGLLLTVPAIGFVLSPLFEVTKRVWVRVGPIDGVPLGRPTALVAAIPTEEAYDATPVDRVVYVVRKANGDVRALSNVCTHMQCNVHWDDRLEQFLCPCHGGLYDIDGNNVGGPPPSPLAQWVHRLEREGDSTVLYVQNQLDESI